jgi:hypothetical protein
MSNTILVVTTPARRHLINLAYLVTADPVPDEDLGNGLQGKECTVAVFASGLKVYMNLRHDNFLSLVEERLADVARHEVHVAEYTGRMAST